MPEIGMSVSMSGDGKRGVGHRPQATAPILDSTTVLFRCGAPIRRHSEVKRTRRGAANSTLAPEIQTETHQARTKLYS